MNDRAERARLKVVDRIPRARCTLGVGSMSSLRTQPKIFIDCDKPQRNDGRL